MALQLRVIKDWDEFLQLEERWDALADSVEQPLAFFMHSWSRAWCEGYGAKERLHIMTAWRGTELIGVLPLVRGTRHILKFIPVCSLISMTSISVSGSNIICRQNDLTSVINLFRKKLLRDNGWGLIDLQYVSSDSATLPKLVRKFNLKYQLFAQTKIWNGSYYVDTRGSFETYYSSLGKSFRKTRKTQDSRLAKIGQVEYEVEIDFNRASMDRFYAMEDTGWKSTKGHPLRRHPQAHKFFDDMSKAFATKKRYMLAHIKVGGTVAASALCVMSAKSMHYLKIAVDYNNQELAKLAPGQALIGYLIRYCFENGLERFDFYGMYADYEAHWSKKADPKQHLLIYNRRNLLVNFHLSLRDAWQYLKSLRLRPAVAPVPAQPE